MQEPNFVARCIESMSSTNLLITIKTRIGYNDVEDSFNFLKSFIKTIKNSQKFIIMLESQFQKKCPKENLNISTSLNMILFGNLKIILK